MWCLVVPVIKNWVITCQYIDKCNHLYTVNDSSWPPLWGLDHPGGIFDLLVLINLDC